jgi:molecular chaperone GrpE (heat shock protein)
VAGEGETGAPTGLRKQADIEAIIKGVQLIHRQLLGVLEKEGVKRIPTVGERFDPHRHEAVAQVDTDAHTVDGAIVEEVQVGYTMHGKVIRPAMVKVAKKSSPQSTVHGPQTEQTQPKDE